MKIDTTNTANRPGEAFVSLAVVVWLSISVGPWWIGLGIMVTGSVLNWIWHRKLSR